MKPKLSLYFLLLTAVGLSFNACKEKVNLSDVDTDNIVLEAGVAAPVAYTTVYATKLYEIKDNDYYLYNQEDGTVVFARRARKRVPMHAFDIAGVTLSLVDSINMSDFFDTNIIKDSHFPIINPFFQVFFRTNQHAEIDAVFSDLQVITNLNRFVPSNYMGDNKVNMHVSTVFQRYRTGVDSADYVNHYLDSLVLQNKEGNFENFFDLPLGEMPQYLQYDFTLKRVDCQPDDTVYVDAWFHMPINAKGLAQEDKWGWILNYYDTLEVDGSDFYDEEIDSLIRKHADFLTIYIDGTNGTPFNITGTCYYLDANKRPLGSGYPGVGHREDYITMPGGRVDADGRVILSQLKPFETQTIELGKANEILADTTQTRLTMERHLVRDMRYIVVNARATAPTNGARVHLVNTDFIKLKVSAKAHAHAQITDF